jgi:integrase
MVSPFRHPKTGMFYFRKAVPAPLRLGVGAVVGRPGTPCAELKWTLGTHDLRAAKALMPAAMARADQMLETARTGATPLSRQQQFALAGLWYQRELAAWEADPAVRRRWDLWDEDSPSSGPSDAEVRGGVELEPWAARERDREWRRFVDQRFTHEVHDLLASQGVVTDRASKEALADIIVERLTQALAHHGRRSAGDYRRDRLPDTFPAWKPSQAPAAGPTVRKTALVSLTALFEAWKTVAAVKPRTVAETEYVVKALAKFVGHDDAAAITPDDMSRWRTETKAAGASNNTWNNRLSAIGQVLRQAVRDRKLSSDPTTGQRLRKERQTSPLPYSDEDAVRLLTAARMETRPSLRWAHWIMAFTGARAGEVLQLLGRDVAQEGGIWFIDINEDGEGKSVKTATRRRVPIHPALIAEGLIRYAQTIKPDAPLFPDKLPDKFGNRGGRAWNVIGAWARRQGGITDPRKAPDHSWRHRVEDELRAAEVAEEVRDAILGHARKTMGRQYGVRGEALARLQRGVSSIPFPPGLVPTTE